MSAREEILTTIREHHPPLRELPEVPDFHQAPAGLIDRFTAALAQLDGTTVTEPPADLHQWLSATFPNARRICAAVPELTGTVTPATFSDWAAPADVDVTIVRTPLGVAETGSILVTEKELEVNTIAVLAQHLVVLLDPADLVENIHDAYQHPRFQEAAYAVLLSGPSGSADIGGKTVHPAQGVTTLTVILSPRPGVKEESEASDAHTVT
ncbi:MAG TPA: LUD domain-containing protein [Ktedonobacteraceae bacterium]|jgi:L-lactate dehydrogenase complex protein LldG|nr:LUD domain-containing protein [Ktedonobacteraceae bacterium]